MNEESCTCCEDEDEDDRQYCFHCEVLFEMRHLVLLKKDREVPRMKKWICKVCLIQVVALAMRGPTGVGEWEGV